jgi:hypothetical protein
MEVWRILQRLCRLLAVTMMLPVIVTTSDIRMSTIADVISAVHKHFSTNCIFLIHEEVQTAMLHRGWTWHRSILLNLSSLFCNESSSGSEMKPPT